MRIFCLTAELKRLPVPPYELSFGLRERGWIVPAYSLPDNAQETTIMRVVVRENFTKDMIDIFVKDIIRAVNKINGKEDKRTGSSPRKSHPVS